MLINKLYAVLHGSGEQCAMDLDGMAISLPPSSSSGRAISSHSAVAMPLTARTAARRWCAVLRCLLAGLLLTGCIAEATAQTGPAVSISAAASPVMEGETADFVLTVDPVPAVDIVVNLDVSDTTSIGSDFLASADEGRHRVLLRAGDATTIYRVNTVDDELDDFDSAVTVTLANGSGYTVGSPSPASVTVSDNDPVPAIRRVEVMPAIEGEDLIVTVTLNQPQVGFNFLSIRLYSEAIADCEEAGCPDGTVPATSADFTALNRVEDYRRGEISKTFRIPTVDDSDMEPPEVFQIFLSGFSQRTELRLEPVPPADFIIDGEIETDSGIATAVEGFAWFATILDNDTPALIFSPDQTVAEGGSVSYTVRLASTPTADVTVTVTGHDDLIPSATALTFTSMNWDVAQRVILTASDDSDLEDDRVTLTHHAAGGGYVSVRGSVQVIITDDDRPGVRFDRDRLVVGEDGTTGSYTVVLEAEPAGDVEITALAGSGARVNGGGAAVLTFTADNWHRVQGVTVAAEDDDIDNAADARTVVIGHTVASAADAGYAGLSGLAAVTVTVADDDRTVASLARVAGPDVLSEGGSVEFTVTLSRVLSAGEVVDVPLSVGGSGITVDDWELRTLAGMGLNTGVSLSGTNVATPGVRFTGAGARVATLELLLTADNLPESGGSERLTLALGADGAGTNGFGRAILGTNVVNGAGPDPLLNAFSITVNDPTATSPVITIAAASPSVSEGSTASYTITANPAPVSPLTIRLRVTDAPADSDFVALHDEGSDTVTIAVGSTTATYSVATVADSTDELDGPVTVRLVADDGYTVGNPSSASVTVNDDDLPTLRVEIPVVTEGEEDAVVTFTLDQPPALRAVRFSVAVVQVTCDRSTPCPDGSSAIAVLQNDRDAPFRDGDDFRQTSLFITFSPGDDNLQATMPIRIADDDLAESVEVFGVTILSSLDGAAMIDPETPRDFLFSVFPAWFASIVDNDAAGVTITQTGGDTMVGERSDMPDSYTVVLESEPTANVTITMDSPAADLMLEKSRLIFTSRNWREAQTVVVRGVDDDRDNAVDRRGTITHTVASVDPNYNTGRSDNLDVMVTVVDDDVAALVLEPAMILLDEGTRSVYQVRLAAEPSGDVRVAITGWTGTDLMPDVAELRFTTGNWSMAQTVTVTAGSDTNTIDDRVILTHSASGGGYDSISGQVEVLIADDNKPTVTINADASPVTEGTPATFTVTASSAPSPALTVHLRVTDDTVSDFLASGSEGARTVTIMAGTTTATYSVPTVGDTMDEPDGIITVSISDEDGYLIGSASSATTIVNDDDAAGPMVSISAAASPVMEGEAADFVLTVDPVPAVDIVVNLDVSDTTSIGSDFLASADEGRHRVLLRAGDATTIYRVNTVDDELDDFDSAVTVTLANGSGYTVGSPSPASVTVSDNDPVPAIRRVEVMPAIEGEDLIVTVTLNQPQVGSNFLSIQVYSEAIADCEEAGCPDGTVPATSADFTASTRFFGTVGEYIRGEISETFRIPTVDDSDMEPPEVFQIFLSAFDQLTEVRLEPVPPADFITDSELATAAEGFAWFATILDNDTPALIFSPDQTVAEGGSVSYTVRLASTPTADVTVTVTGHDDLIPSATALTFTPMNWDVAQRVILTASDDSDLEDDRVTLTHRAAGGGYGSVRGSVQVIITDDDRPGVRFDRDRLVVGEDGTTGSYMVVLEAEPAGDVEITALAGSGARVNGGGAAVLTFTADNWHRVQGVTVAAEDDDIDNAADARTVVIGHTVASAADAGYAGLSGLAAVTVTVADDDRTVASLARVAGPDVLSEGGSVEFTVTLSRVLSAGEVVDVPLSVGGSGITVDDWELRTLAGMGLNTGVSLSGTNVATPGVRFTGAGARVATLELLLTADNLPESGGSERLTLALGADGAGTNGFGRAVLGTNVVNGAGPDPLLNAFSITVNDPTATSPVITIAAASPSLSEGSTASYTITANPAPVSPLTVRLRVTDAPADSDFVALHDEGSDTVTIAVGSTTATYSVATVADSTDELDGPVTVRLVADDGYTVGNPSSASVTVNDDDLPTLRVEIPVVTEGEEDAVVTFTLDQPPALRAVRFSVDVIQVTCDRSTPCPDGSSAIAVLQEDRDAPFRDGDDFRRAGLGITFSPGDDNLQATMPIRTADDDLAESVEVFGVVIFTLDGAMIDPETPRDFLFSVFPAWFVSIVDNDAAGVTITQAGGDTTVGERSDMPDSYTVVLESEPTANVTITMDSPAADLMLEKSRLIFTSRNWREAQTVVVRGVDDDRDNGNRQGTITHTVASVDPDYNNGRSDNLDVMVTVVDDDVAALVLEPAMILLDEGTRSVYQVRLAAEPGGDVRVAITGWTGTDLMPDVAELRFTTGNWSMAQTVTVTAGSDTNTIDDRVILTHSASGGGYDSISGQVEVLIADDNKPTVTINADASPVTEGTPATFTVTASSAPSPALTVHLRVTDDTVSDFLASGSEGARTVTIMAGTTTATYSVPTVGDTMDEPDGIITVSISDEDGYLIGSASSVITSVNDDDAAGVTVGSSTVAIDEGGSATYTVVLDSRPAANVVITPTIASVTPAFMVQPATLTFTPANWSDRQPVTVTGLDNDIDDGALAGSVTHAITAPAAGGYAVTLAISSVSVMINDDDEAGVTIGRDAVTVDEDGSAIYTVVLDSQPATRVVIMPATTGDSSAFTAAPATLIFTPENWKETQQITVAGVDNDIDDNGGTGSVTHVITTAAAGGYPVDLSISAVSVTINNDDEAGVTIGRDAVTVDEDGSAIYTVVLDSQPAARVVIMPTVIGTEFTAQPTTLTFTTENWNVMQDITIAGVDNNVGDGQRTGSVTHVITTAAADGYPTALAISTVRVTINDNDNPGITVSENDIMLDEAGGTVAYTLVLDTEPAGNVVITLSGHASTALRVDTDPDMNGDQNTLTFSSDNWNEAQTVTLVAGADSNSVDETITLTHMADSGYGSVQATLLVDIADDDMPRVVLGVDELTVIEGGSASYTVELGTRPSGNVTVTLSGQGSTLRPDRSELTFDASNWDQAQTITLTALDDADSDDDVVTLAHTADASYGDDVTADLTVTVIDSTPQLMFSQTAVSVGEGGSTSYTLELSAEPVGTVTVTLTGHDDTELTPESTELFFTPDNWDQAQTVTLVAGTDSNSVDETIVLMHRADAGYGAVTEEVTVTIIDSDTPRLILDVNTLNVTEEGTATYTVRLGTRPGTNVTVMVTGQSGDLRVDSGADLTFTPDNWNEGQAVTLSAIADDDSEDETPITLTHTAAGGEYDTASAESLMVRILDNTEGLVLSTGSLDMEENDTASYTVRLALRPMADVTVSVSSGDTTRLRVTDGDSLTFTPTDWSRAQTVTVIARDDADSDTNQVTLTHMADSGYGSVQATLPVDIADDDIPRVVLGVDELTVIEGGSASYTVELGTRPSGDVTVALSGQGSTLRPDRSELTFDASNWDRAQTITLTAVMDSNTTLDQVTLTHTASGYGADPVGLPVAITDSTPQLMFSQTAVSVSEGGSTSYTLELSAEPVGTVTVTLSGHERTELTPEPTELTFTQDNWSEAQAITLTAGTDSNSVNETITLTHSADAGYGAVTEEVTVTIIDSDTPRLILDVNTLNVTEEGTATYTVRLGTRPGTNVTVTVTGQSGDLRVDSGADLTFTPDNWNEGQAVTLSAIADDDSEDETPITLTHTAAGGEYDTASAESLMVRILDNTEGLVLSTSSLDMAEDSAESYTVRLSLQPRANVTVSVSSGDTTRLRVTDGDSLTFTPTDWSRAQTVTVMARDDADSDTNQVTLTHMADAGYGSVQATLPVDIADDDIPRVVLGVDELTVIEGGSASYTVALGTRPSGNVTVALSGQGSTLRPDRSELAFDAGNWDQAQTITLTAVMDSNTTLDQVTLTHTASGYSAAPVDLPVTITDSTPQLMFSQTAVSVGEGGSTSYTLELSAEPVGTVTVTLSGHERTELTPEPTELTFTQDNWSEAQAITLTAGTDSNSVNETITLTHSADAGYGAVTEEVTVTVRDADTPRLILNTDELIEGGSATYRVTEQGSATYTVRLGTQPSGNVTVTITGQSGTDLTVDSGNRLTFTQSNWNEEQVVTLLAVEDTDSEDEALITLTHTAAGAEYDTASAESLMVRIMDNTPALMLSTEVLTLQPGGSSSYTVRLMALRPTMNVTVTVTGHEDTGLTVAPESLTFSMGNWNMAQTITVTAGTDSNALSNRVILTHMASGGNYDRVTAQVEVEVRVGSMEAMQAAQQMWLPRFGLTAIEHMLGGLHHRFTASDQPGLSGNLNGLPRGQSFNAARLLSSRGGPDASVLGIEQLGAGSSDRPRKLSRTLSLPKLLPSLLRGSHFTFTDQDGTSIWGQAAYTKYKDGEEAGTSIDGEVTTAMLGIDRDNGQTLVGLALAYSDSDGEWQGASASDEGELSGMLVSMLPYLRYDLSERLQLWGAASYGRGDLKQISQTGMESKHNLVQLSATAGLRGTLLERPMEEGGLTLELISGLTLARIETDDSRVMAGTEADTQRFRMGLEWSWQLPEEDGVRLTPELELGLRYDGGDTSEGFGLELGGGLSWQTPAKGLTVDIRGRYLLEHEAAEREEWGLSGSLRYEAWPNSAYGPSFSLRHEYGNAPAASGLDRLLSDSLTDALEEEDNRHTAAVSSRWTLKGEWGFALTDDATGIPYASLSASDAKRDLTLGWRLLSNPAGLKSKLDIKAIRREQDGNKPKNSVGAEWKLNW